MITREELLPFIQLFYPALTFFHRQLKSGSVENKSKFLCILQAILGNRKKLKFPEILHQTNNNNARGR